MAVGYGGYLMQTWSVHKQIMTIAQGTKVLGLATNRLSKINLNLPSLPEQQKIASFLTAVDDKISQLTKKKELLEDYKKGVMQRIFSLNHDSCDLHDDHDGVKDEKKSGQSLQSKKSTFRLRFRDENGNDFPEWEEKKLGEVCQFLDGKRKPLKETDRKKIQGIYPYYGASGVIDYVNDYIFNEDIVLLGEDGENIISRNLPLVFKVTGKCWVNNHAHVLKPASGYNIDFLVSNMERISYLKYNTGTAQPKLNQDVCKKITLPFPCLQEQQKIASFLTSIDDKIEQVNTQLEKAKTWKKGLLQKMFV